MKFPTLLQLQAVLALAGFASASSSSSSPSAALYIFSKDEHKDKTPLDISETETRLILASRLGLSRYHALGKDVDFAKVEKAGNGQKLLWQYEHERTGHVVIYVGGVSNTDGIVDGVHPEFALSNAPSASSFRQLFKNLEAQAEDVIGKDGQPMYTNSFGSFIDVVSPSKMSRSFEDHALPSDWTAFEKMVGSDSELFKQDVKSDVTLFEEIMLLQELATSTIDEVMSEKAILIAHFTSLEAVYRKYGASSLQYRVGSRIFSTLITRVSSKLAGQPSSIIVGSTSNRLAKKDFIGTEITKRKIRITNSKEESMLLASSSSSSSSTSQPTSTNPPLFVGPYRACYTTEHGCQNGTDNCNGRGTCMASKTQSRCWSCACNATYVEVKLPDGSKGNKTTYWGGSACQKKDVSTPFLLFVGFTIFIILAIASIISMMMNMGNEELPGTLSAGVSYKRS